MAFEQISLAYTISSRHCCYAQALAVVVYVVFQQYSFLAVHANFASQHGSFQTVQL